MDLYNNNLENKVKERAYYMYINNELNSDEERYYTALLIETFDNENTKIEQESDDSSYEEVEYCEICHNFKHEGNCDEDDLEKINEIIQYCGTDINNCPSCDTIIFSDGGCNQFFCWNCSVMFDWNTKEIMYSDFSFSGESYYQKFKEDIDNGQKGVRLEHFQPYYETEIDYFDLQS